MVVRGYCNTIKHYQILYGNYITKYDLFLCVIDDLKNKIETSAIKICMCKKKKDHIWLYPITNKGSKGRSFGGGATIL